VELGIGFPPNHSLAITAEKVIKSGPNVDNKNQF